MIATCTASTWTTLFPPDSSYRCAASDSAPSPWVRELVEAHRGGGRSVEIFTARSADALPDLDSRAGLVAVNCRGLSDRRLREAGFTYVRRFAVVPDLDRARFFVPLDSPAVSAAAFQLWSPLKSLARQKHRAVRAAARLGLPVWYRDQVCIAQRNVPPLEDKLRALFPGQEVRLALSAGSPPPTRNRKITLAAIDAGGSVLAFGKLPGPLPVSVERVRHEAEVLAVLAARPRRPRVPRLLFAGPVADDFLVATEPLPGGQPGTRWTAAHDRFLDSLRDGEAKPADQTGFVGAIREQASLLAGRPDLLRVLHDLLPRLRDLVLPARVVHGDFAPWNLRRDGGEIAAYDWECGSIDGLPLIDEIHHLLAPGFLLHKWTAEQALDRLRAMAHPAHDGLRPDVVTALGMTYLLDYLVRLFAEGYGDDYPRVEWCRQLLNRLAAAGAQPKTA